jgi:glycogen operon protein
VFVWLLVSVSCGESIGLAVGPDRLGASFDDVGTQVTFRVFSSRATRVEVWVYHQPFGKPEKAKFEMTADPATNIWSKTVPVADLSAAGVGATIYYGYRVWGPNWPFDAAWTKGSHAGFISDVDDQGNRFNPNKLLLDPYALEVSHDARSARFASDAIFLSGPQRDEDTGNAAPKGIVLRPSPADATAKPTRAFKDDVVYEVHLRGLTKNDPSVPMNLRGTYAGAALKAPYLKSLGVTAIELLPVQEVQNDQNDIVASTDGDNYWGYDPLNYFAPDRRYAADQKPGGPTREFQAMTKAFHEHGIKVYIDVVYNHTGEGGVGSDPTIARLHSFRGLDNAAYYELAEDRRFYFDSNGVGANFNAAHPRVRQLVIDSLKHWKDTLGVDGYRFDLASVLGNACLEGCFSFNKFDPQNVLNRAVAELPVRPGAGGPGVDLIAEPWAIGNGTYQVGQFPHHWVEWNDKFRDTFRMSQNKLGFANVPPAELARRFAGSSDLFQDDGRKPWHSLNFIVAHDGFTLRDLYSFNSKQNGQPFPFGPSDGGSDNNIAWDQGGDAVLQRQAARNGLAFLMLSAGVPMITGGDEMYRTQFGNNNVYNLDSDKNHLDWEDATRFPRFLNYTKKLIAFRRAHPALRPAEFFQGRDTNNNGRKDITWFRDSGAEADGAYLDNADNHFLAYRLDGTELGDTATSVYVAYNGWSGEVTATLPANTTGHRWFRVADTDQWMEDQDNFEAPGAEEPLDHSTYKLHPRSLLVLIEK